MITEADGAEGDQATRRARLEGKAPDVAHAAVFLAADEAGFIAGAVLPDDGGVSLRTPER